MSPSEAKRLRLTDRKRAAILGAALAEFQERGYLATSMDRIAASAEVSKRTVYNHFKSKDLLFLAVVSQLWDQLAAASFPPPVDDPVEAQLRQLGDLQLRLSDSAKGIRLVRVALAEFVRSPELARRAFENLGDGSPLTRWFTLAFEAKLLVDGDPILAANQFLALLKGFAFYPQVLLGAATLTADERTTVIEEAARMLVLRYGPSEGGSGENSA